MEINKDLYFVGHAHLDPAWVWDWKEGSAEAKATIRSALDRIKEYPDFKFIFPTALVYTWIEDFDPEMFREMQQRVEEGRLILVGGSFVEPDENIAGGEGLARQYLYAQRYFKEKFGKTVEFGFNPDGFGHSEMMPQILKKSGIKNYMFMRPEPWNLEKDIESNVFRWVSPDGSQVLGCRLIGYGNAWNFFMADVEELENQIAKKLEYANDGIDEFFFFYGVGNHGGGPTKKNIETLLEAQKKYPEKHLKFSDIKDFWDAIDTKGYALPLINGEMQRVNTGCYSAVSEIKRYIRRCEENLVAAEKFSKLAEKLVGKAAPDVKEFEKAWRKVLFMHFHDVSCGTCIKSAYDVIYNMAGAALNFADETQNSALQTVSWKIDTSDSSKGTPIVVFNPHSFPIRTAVPVNLQLESWRITDAEGNVMPAQIVRGEGRHCKGLGDNTLFIAEVPALGYATYYISKESAEQPKTELKAEKDTLENSRLKVTFDMWSGQLKSVYDKANDRELFSSPGAVPIVIDEFNADTWGHDIEDDMWNDVYRYNNVIGQFSDAKITLLEKGPVRATVRVESFYGKSKLTQYFSLCEGSDSLDVRTQIDWQEKHKMLKLCFPVNADNGTAYYEVPFGVVSRPGDGLEVPMQQWMAVKDGEYGVAIINDCKYGASADGNTLKMTACRSPIYNDQKRNRLDPDAVFTDQGVQEFNYCIMPFKGDWVDVKRRAALLNCGATHIIENNHNGTLPLAFSGIECSCDNVVLTALKNSENGKGTICRITEFCGKDSTVSLSGAVLPAPLNVSIGKWATDTYYLEKGSNTWKKVLLTEFDIDE